MKDTTDIETEHEGSFVAPGTPIEQSLVEIWQEILDLEEVGVQDNFFDLGGHSLLAMRLLSYIRKAFQCNLSLKDFFGAATIADQAKVIEGLISNEQSISIPALMPISREGELALSFAQERLWFLDLLEPHNLAYNIPVTFFLQGPLIVIALQKSIQQLIDRHETLRTTFSVQEGKPVQVIAPDLYLALPVVDLSLFSNQEQLMMIRQLAREDGKQPFDLRHGPLIRLTLLRLAENQHVLLFTVHHICFDEWSGRIFQRELALFYNGWVTHSPVPLASLPIQYVDYAFWQREWVQGERLEQLLAYWRERLTDAPTLLELPTDHPHPALQQYQGATVSFVLSADFTHLLHEVCQREGATLFMGLLSAFAIFLQRYSGQTDLVVGTPIAGRMRRETEGLIGLFINTLVLRLGLAGDPTVRELIRRVRATCLAAYEHQELPLEKLVEALQPERNLSYNPVFQVMFVMQNIVAEKDEFVDLCVERTVRNEEVAPVDLTLEFREKNDGVLAGIFKYRIDLFEEATVKRMVEHFQVLLQSIVTHPGEPLSSLVLLTEDERERLLIGWKQTTHAYSPGKSLPELIEEQVERTPDAVAVQCEEEQVTYRELNGRANQLARSLLRQGVGPEVRVGICMDRSVAMLIGVLAILKAGGTFLPLDPTYPQDRLTYLLEDACVTLLLTMDALRAKLPAMNVSLFCLDRNGSLLAEESPDNLHCVIEAENLLYIIYTSGSSGQPKGAGIHHGAFLNLLLWFCDTFDLTTLDRGFLISSFSFDLTQKNIFAPLMVGATLYLPATHQYNPDAFIRIISEQGITWLNCTPSAFYPLIEGLDVASFSAFRSLRYLFLGGEPIAHHRFDHWIRSPYYNAQIVNTYGPTECSDIATSYILEPMRLPEEATVPIGKPIRNVEILVLNEALQLVPIGVPGQLYIGGGGVGRGYIDRPDLTAERFVPHPFNQEPGSRLYRTGDLVRYHADGTLEYLGRLDRQVKVQGFRIELEEIESNLHRHPALQECAVVLHENLSERWLVAYLVWIPTMIAPPMSELRAFLQKQLPDYMLPAFFISLPQLPLTPNGKLDRSNLPVTDQVYDRDRKDMPALSLTPLEEQLAEIWRQVLGLEQVGNDENFFDLGGHSLLATQIITRLREHLQVDLPLRVLFEAPTIEKMANAIVQRQAMSTSVQEQKEEPIRAYKDSNALLLSKLDQISNEDVDALIRDLTKNRDI